MGKMAFLLIVTISLSACVAGSRDVASDFNHINGGQIPKDKVPEFVDCVSDKFRDRTIGIDNNLFNRQNRRSNGYRVELVSSVGGIAVSADVFDDGRVELFERAHVRSSAFKGERDGFDVCLSKYKITQQ